MTLLRTVKLKSDLEGRVVPPTGEREGEGL